MAVDELVEWADMPLIWQFVEPMMESNPRIQLGKSIQGVQGRIRRSVDPV
jgi:hypothetical protein